MPSVADSNAATQQEIRDVVAMTVFAAFADGNAFPSVLDGGSFATANTIPTTYFNFADGYDGQRIVVLFKDVNTTIAFSAGGIIGNDGINWNPGLNDCMICTFDGTNWYAVTSTAGITDHTLLSNIGTNSHTAIDTHIADSTIHYLMGDINITKAQISDLGTGASNWLYSNAGIDFINAPEAPDNRSFAIGDFAVTNGEDTIAIGTGTYAEGQGGIAFGINAQAIALSTALSPNNMAIGASCLAIGDQDALAIGNNCVSSEAGTLAAGNFVEARGIGSAAVGNNVFSDTDYEAVFGTENNTLSLVGGALSVDSMYILNTYTVATLPAVSLAGLIYVSDGAAGSPVMAFSDAVNWLRCDTLAVVA